ncbi:MAG: hypothetical protein HC927_13680 [Deltaproteobacteria bacterium]|nr:hypothetical protein [Deltaproteobacteria bacterium]
MVWFGQLISLTGSEMSAFALALWAWSLTGQATALALVALFSGLPRILLSPVLAGAAMAASSISVLLNALRLLRWKSP